MSLIQAIILGIIEGLTEFLPVSSTGHLLLTQRLMGLPADELANAYAIVIQGGAIVAVMGLYRNRLVEMFRGIFLGEAAGRRLAVNLMIAFFPAALIGLLFDKKIEHYLFGLWAVAAAWIFWGVVLIVFSQTYEKKRKVTAGKNLAELLPKHAFFIGLAQSLAMWPGTSRSLVTILAALLLGFALGPAVEFSFLLGLITLGAATVYKAKHFGPQLFGAAGLTTSLVGIFTACLFAALSIKWMLHYLQRHSLAIFGYWRIIIAGLAIGLIFQGSILP